MASRTPDLTIAVTTSTSATNISALGRNFSFEWVPSGGTPGASCRVVITDDDATVPTLAVDGSHFALGPIGPGTTFGGNIGGRADAPKRTLWALSDGDGTLRLWRE